LLQFRSQNGPEKVGENTLDGRSQPEVEIITQVSVTDVVVVRRVGTSQDVACEPNKCCGIKLVRMSWWLSRQQRNAIGYYLDTFAKARARFSKRVGFGIIPDHRKTLFGKGRTHGVIFGSPARKGTVVICRSAESRRQVQRHCIGVCGCTRTSICQAL